MTQTHTKCFQESEERLNAPFPGVQGLISIVH